MKQNLFRIFSSYQSGIAVALLFALNLFVYQSTLDNGFISEDFLYLQYAREILQSENYSLFFQPLYGMYIRPLVGMTVTLLSGTFGMNVLPYRLLILISHCITVILFFFFVRKLCSTAKMKNPEQWAATASLIFSVAFPFHEALLYFSALADVLCALFLLASLLIYLCFQDTGKPLKLLSSLFFYALALLAKQTAFVLPMLVFFLSHHFYPNAQRPAPKRAVNALKRTLPFIMTGLCFALFYLMLSKNAPSEWNAHRTLMNLTRAPVSLLVWSAQWFYNYSPLAPEPFKYILGYDQKLNLFMVTLACAFFIVTLLLFLLRRRSQTNLPFDNSLLFLSLLWIVLTLLPATAVTTGSRETLQENAFPSRYYYLPSLGFALFLALVFMTFSETLASASKFLKIAIVLPVMFAGLNAVFFQMKEAQYSYRGFLAWNAVTQASSLTRQFRDRSTVIYINTPEELVSRQDILSLAALLSAKPRSRIFFAGSEEIRSYLCGRSQAQGYFYLYYDEEKNFTDRTQYFRKHFASCW